MDHHQLSYKQGIKDSYKGAKELRQYATEKFGELPFIIELHDTPLYQADLSVRYDLMHPVLNTKLRDIFFEYTQQTKIKDVRVYPIEMKGMPGYHSTTLEFWPTHFQRKTGNFDTLTVDEAEVFSRDIIEFIQKKN